MSHPPVDAVVVTYNSAETIEHCICSLAADTGTTVWIVDNSSTDETLEKIASPGASILPQEDNRGFAAGCNVGIRAGSAPYVLLLNPDAVVAPGAIARLVATMEADDTVGICAPKILESDGRLEHSQRSFPRLRTTFAQALFAHRVFPNAPWADELDRREESYAAPGSPDWVSGACMMVRRSLLEQLGGLDEGFFLYGEDIDLCRRARDAGFDVRFEPTAVVMHLGGASAPRPQLRLVLVASRIRYLRKHTARPTVGLARLGMALSELTHLLVSSRGLRGRIGHARALQFAVVPRDVDDVRALARRALGR